MLRTGWMEGIVLKGGGETVSIDVRQWCTGPFGGTVSQELGERVTAEGGGYLPFECGSKIDWEDNQFEKLGLNIMMDAAKLKTL